MDILNVAFYKFVELDNLDELRFTLKQRTEHLKLMGSILLSQEGINTFVAGDAQNVRSFISFLEQMPQFGEFSVKESWTAHMPFKRMVIKIKSEIIAMGEPDIQPGRLTGRRLAPLELKAWLDEGRPVTLLDTRNDYEVELGTFDHAKILDLKTFKEFPKKLQEVTAELKDQPVVMFCTGGIRCEKATALAVKYGFNDVYQLEGGILRYFEEAGSAHYKGECFVFDSRVAVDPNLSGAKDRTTNHKMSNITLHSYRRCPYAIRVRMVLEEKSIPYTVVEENLSELSPELLKNHPEGRVPLLIHHDQVMYESSIITEYLDEEFPEPRLRTGSAAKNAKMRLMTYWCNEIFKPDLDAYKYEFKNMSTEDRAALIDRMEKHLFEMQKPLEKYPYLLGDNFTLADIHLFPFYRQFQKVQSERSDGLANMERFKRLDNWLARIIARPSFERVIQKRPE